MSLPEPQKPEPKEPARAYGDATEIEAIVREFEAGTLPNRRWSHFAHLTVTMHYLQRDGYERVAAELPDRIRLYNLASGVPNSDTRGYHETITRVFLLGLRRYLALLPPGEPLLAAVNGLLTSPFGHRDFPLRFYSHALLFSVAARRTLVTPDLEPLARIETLSLAG